MNLKRFQEQAIADLLRESKRYLPKSVCKRIVLKSPTGSGKTVIIAEFLKHLTEEQEFKDSLSFVWIAPNKLHSQSKIKLSEYYEEDRFMECLYFEDLNSRTIKSNEILFLNWQSINKDKNLYIRENERDNNLPSVIKRTRNEGYKIILIVDESHRDAKTEKSKQIVSDINPNIIIDVSATPSEDSNAISVNVDIDDVKIEGMIKKSVQINPDLPKEDDNMTLKLESQIDRDDFILKESIEQRNKLLKVYKDQNLDINPLLLIQLPDRKTEQDEKLKENIIMRLDSEFEINTANKKLGIWLDDKKENLENIEDKNNQVQVLIFKQAIALGWDCPRAHILALFREWKKEAFSIQTIGRIMRMPDVEYGHYQNDFEILNHAYIYTSIPNIKISDAQISQHLATYKSIRESYYESLNLVSYYRKRQRERTRFSSDFMNIFLVECKNKNIKNKLNITNQKVKEDFIMDEEIENIDKIKGEIVEGKGKADISDNVSELQRVFDNFIRNSLEQEPYFFPESRSIDYLKKSIYEFFENEFNKKIENEDSFKEIIKIVLSEENNNYFLDIINSSKEQYKIDVETKDKGLNVVKWNVPEFITFNENYGKKEVSKSVMKPFYIHQNASNPEKKFIEFLERQRHVKWWFKNRDHGLESFSIPYKEEDKIKLFYVDFVVYLKNGKIALFDTKSGFTEKEAESKVKGLKDYVNENDMIYDNSGIVSLKGGVWKVYKEQGQKFDVYKSENWILLDLN